MAQTVYELQCLDGETEKEASERFVLLLFKVEVKTRFGGAEGVFWFPGAAYKYRIRRDRDLWVVERLPEMTPAMKSRVKARAELKTRGR